MRDWGEKAAGWQPPRDWDRVLAVDAHTAGEPLRVILAGFPPLDGGTVPALRRQARAEHDGLRRALMWEPRGHADMYGCVVVPPVSGAADLGVLFLHNEGFSTMCGHGIIGVVTVLVELGLLPAPGPGESVGIDTPAGFVEARVEMDGDRVASVAFVNVPSFVVALDATVRVEGVGPVRYDLAFGGAFYAVVDAAALGLRLDPGSVGRIIEAGRAVTAGVRALGEPSHPLDPDLGFLYGTILTAPPASDDGDSRNVCVFADGEVDRSPTGTGVSARLAIEHARGALAAGEAWVVESVLGTKFRGRVVGTARVGAHEAVVPEVEGSAFITGRNELWLDPTDPLREGFLLR